MTPTMIYAILTLTAIGGLAAVILYFLAQRFKVVEDPRIDEIEQILPGANCGACGFAGCRNFAEAVVKARDLSTLYCPVGGNECMCQVARVLGLEAVAKEPLVAVVRCAGTFQNRPKTNTYDSARSCAVSCYMYSGDTGCPYGCLGHGDCVTACKFDAIVIDPKIGLPVVSEEKCTACGACVLACPLDIIELRKKGRKNLRVYVSCVNKDKGAVARKACSVACIGCGRCVKECPCGAITMQDNLAYIDFEKCKLCRKCVAVCPTHAIWEVNFPPRKEKAPAGTSPAAPGTENTDTRSEG